MLSVSTIKSASKAGAYYTAEDNYYFLGEQATEWYGTGAESLGLSGPVNKDVFTELLEGKLPDGTDLTRMEGGENKHRPGYDLTFSAPKSVSVLALVTDDKQLIEAHRRAVGRTLDEVEKLASTRTMTQGISSTEQTGNLIVARFMHDTSRNLDPNLHDHAVVINATLAEAGWKTLSTDIKGKQGFTDVVWNQQVSIGTLYRGFLRQDVEEMGYPTHDTGPRGEWDITGVPVKEFSSRREEIMEKVGPDASAKQKSVAALDTRNSKEFSDMEGVREHWKEQLADTGFNIDEFRKSVEEKRASLEELAGPDLNHSSSEPQPVNTGPSRQPVDKDVSNRTNAFTAPVKEAIDRISSRSVRFSYDDVLTSVLNHSALEPGIYGQVRQALDIAIENGKMLAVDKKQTLFTSPAHVRDENRLLQLAAGVAEKSGGLAAQGDEKGVMARVADADRALTLIDVRGGAAFVNDVNRSIENLADSRNRPLVIVTADKAALKRQAGSFSERRGQTLMTAEDIKGHQLPAGALVLVSEAERFSTTALHDVLKEAALQGASALVTDTHARRATGFGSEVLKAAGVANFTATPATETVSVRMVQKDTVDDRLTVAARYYAQEKAQGNEARLQAGNSRVREQLTTRVRDVMTDEGQLGRVLGEVTARIPVWLDASNRNDRSLYREGMVMEQHHGRGIIETFTIAGVSERHNLLTLSDEKGETRGMRISDVDSHWKLFKEKRLEVREGEQLRATATLGPRTGSGDALTVTGVKTGRWLSRDKLVMENAKGERVQVNSNAPLYADYGYTESIGATRSSTGNVIAVLAGKEVSDETVNMLRRSGGNVIAFTPLDENTIGRRLEQNRPVVTVTQGIKSLSGEESLTDALRTLDAKKMSYPERAVRMAIEKVTGTGVTFQSLEVISGVISSDKNISPERAAVELQRLEERGEIFPLSAEQGAAGAYMSRENFENEKTILQVITEGKNSVSPLVPKGIPAEAGAPLTEGQRTAGNLILTSRDRIITIQGSAGVGKTTQFRTVAGVLNTMDSPPEIVGLAPTHVAVGELSAAGIPAQTIASFLSEQSQWQSAGQAKDFSNTVFVIDESSMNGNAQMAALLTAVADGNGRAVLNGDKDQLKSLESGVPFALSLERSTADGAVMKEIVRQTPTLKPAIEAVIAGNVQEALRIAEATGPEVVPRQAGGYIPESSIVSLAGKEGASIHDLIAADYTGRTKEGREGTLIVAELNADREAINESIHGRLIKDGTVRDAVTVPLLVRVSNSNADLGRQKFWNDQTGNVMKMGDKHFRIGSADPASGIIRMTGLDGDKDRWFSPAELRKEAVAVFEEVKREIGVGEKIRLTSTDKERNVRASDMATVTGVTAAGQLELDTGDRKLKYDPGATYADRNMDYGYAVTTYSSQGASVRFVVALVGDEGARKVMAAMDSTYVAMSRAKEHIQMYADNMEKWTKNVMRNSGRRQTAHDVVMRTEDIKAGQETRLWDVSKPVSETRMSLRSDQHLTADARFMSGKTPEILWPVINSHGKQRGNWHVPVSPSTGEVNFNAAHYDGAADGIQIVLQRGEGQEKVLEAASISDALKIMVANPNNPVVLAKERPADETEKTLQADAAAAGEEMQVRDEEALKEAIKTAMGDEEKEPSSEMLQPEEKARVPDEERDEKSYNGLRYEAERELEDNAFERYGREMPDDVNRERDLSNEEVNMVRHEHIHTKPEQRPSPQKILE